MATLSGCRRFESLVVSSSSTASGPERTAVSYGPVAQKTRHRIQEEFETPRNTAVRTSDVGMYNNLWKKKYDVCNLKGTADCLG